MADLKCRWDCPYIQNVLTEYGEFRRDAEDIIDALGYAVQWTGDEVRAVYLALSDLQQRYGGARTGHLSAEFGGDPPTSCNVHSPARLKEDLSFPDDMDGEMPSEDGMETAVPFPACDKEVPFHNNKKDSVDSRIQDGTSGREAG